MEKQTLTFAVLENSTERKMMLRKLADFFISVLYKRSSPTSDCQCTDKALSVEASNSGSDDRFFSSES